MSDTQCYSATLTFASRLAFRNAFGIVPIGEDRDGRLKNIPPAGPSTLAPDNTKLKALAKELWEAMKSVRGTEHNWNAANQWLWREEILDGAVPEEAPHLTEKRFREVIAKAKGKL